MVSESRSAARRWWWVAVLGMSSLATVLALANLQTPWRIGVALGGIALLVLAWGVLGDPRVNGERPSWLLVLAVAVAAGIATAGYASLAILQAIAYPVAWVFSARARHAVLGNLVVATAVGAGFLFSIGSTPDDVLQIVFTQSLAITFSLAMGFWITRTTELGERNGELLRELQGAQTQIATLHREAGATAEREHLARELHDTIAQDLTGLVMLAQRARRELGDSETLRIIEENARATLAETRALVASSAALGDDTTDLASALQRLAERFSRETGVEVTCNVAAKLALDRETEVVVLRCVQEALGNARKHARASRIAIAVTAPEGDTHRVRVEITDDGIGFDPTSARDGFGLSGMTDRLALVHGTLEVRSAAGAGTTLVAELPAAGVTA